MSSVPAPGDRRSQPAASLARDLQLGRLVAIKLWSRSAAGQRTAVFGNDGNPFAGLAPFQDADADRFYGRTREVGAVVARLRSCPLIALAGPSGVGKSSLVRAGIIPQLKSSGEGWDALVLRPASSASPCARGPSARGRLLVFVDQKVVGPRSFGR